MNENIFNKDNVILGHITYPPDYGWPSKYPSYDHTSKEDIDFFKKYFKKDDTEFYDKVRITDTETHIFFNVAGCKAEDIIVTEENNKVIIKSKSSVNKSSKFAIDVHYVYELEYNEKILDVIYLSGILRLDIVKENKNKARKIPIVDGSKR